MSGSKKYIWFVIVCLLATGLMATSARADVTYSFSGTNDSTGDDSLAVGFQYTTSSFITSATSLLQSQLDSCLNCQNSLDPDVYIAPSVPDLGDLLQFNDSNEVSSFYQFVDGAFGAAGTYYSGGLFNNTGVLTVSVSVPEPSSVALTLVAGMMLALFVCFRREFVIAPSRL